MNKIKSVKITDDITIGGSRPFTLIAGPCVIENEHHCVMMAEGIKEICEKLNIPFIFKASFDKANRSSIDSYRGVGISEGMKVLKLVKQIVGIPVTTDVHEIEQVDEVKNVVDLIQIPALLCRQTDLIAKAAKTGKPINIKKGQFMSPTEIRNAVEKVTSTGNRKVLLTERGTIFGYNNLVVDMRSLAVMRGFAPVIFDATHSVQMPGLQGKTSGGQRNFVKYLARASIGVGVDALFMEVHDNPDAAPCDGPNMISLNELHPLLENAKSLDKIVKRLTL